MLAEHEGKSIRRVHQLACEPGSNALQVLRWSPLGDEAVGRQLASYQGAKLVQGRSLNGGESSTLVVKQHMSIRHATCT